MKMRVNDVIAEILSVTDEVTFRDLIAVVDKLIEEGYTEESIIDSLCDIKHKLLMITAK